MSFKSVFILDFSGTELEEKKKKKRKIEKEGCNIVIYVLQIICTSTHNVSFAQVRGSVPVYWSQPGYKYRPPPRLDRGIYFILCLSKRI